MKESRIKQLVILAKEISDEMKLAKNSKDPSGALIEVDPIIKDLLSVPGMGITIMECIITLGSARPVIDIISETDPRKKMSMMMESLKNLMMEEDFGLEEKSDPFFGRYQ